MAWFHFSLNSLRRLSRDSNRKPRRKRLGTLEVLEGRQLLSQTNPSVIFAPILQSNMISGPEGDLWVGGIGPTPTSATIDRIGLDGSITSFPVPGPNAIDAITAGPDDNVWFLGRTEDGDTEYVGNVTAAGQVTEYAIPDPGGQQFYGTDAIVAGPGGDIWFDYGGGNVNGIGRVTPAGMVTLFPIAGQQEGVLSMATGPDGNVWFTDGNTGIGRMTTSGAVTEFSTGALDPTYIGNGPNGSLIVTATNARGNNTVFQLSTAGIITRYKVPAAISGAFEYYLGAVDGSLWFSFIKRLGRITASGKATSYPMSRVVGARSHSVESMATGANGDVYLLDYYSETINRIAPGKLPQVHDTGMPRSR